MLAIPGPPSTRSAALSDPRSIETCADDPDGDDCMKRWPGGCRLRVALRVEVEVGEAVVTHFRVVPHPDPQPRGMQILYRWMLQPVQGCERQILGLY